MSIPGLLPFAVLSQTNDPTMVLTQVAKAVEAISVGVSPPQASPATKKYSCCQWHLSRSSAK